MVRLYMPWRTARSFVGGQMSRTSAGWRCSRMIVIADSEIIAISFLGILGTVITMDLECFPQGEVALDITLGKLFLRCTSRERQSAD